MKLIYYLATSLDGFIADVNHGVDWLDQIEIDQQASGYEAFFAGIDGLLMGRKTYDFVYNFGQWPYGTKPTWVCSRRSVPSMDGCILQDERSPQTAVQQAKQQGLSTLWLVGGGQLAAQLIQDRLLTHLSISVMPILLGTGIPLVQALPDPTFLKQEKSTTLGGFTQIEYRIKSF